MYSFPHFHFKSKSQFTNANRHLGAICMGIINGVETTLPGTLFVSNWLLLIYIFVVSKNILKTTDSLALLLEKGDKVVGFAQYAIFFHQDSMSNQLKYNLDVIIIFLFLHLHPFASHPFHTSKTWEGKLLWFMKQGEENGKGLKWASCPGPKFIANANNLHKLFSGAEYLYL